MILKIIKWILSWLKGHKKEVVVFGGVVGSGAAGAGLVNAHNAKKINKRALSIQQETLQRHDREYSETQCALTALGSIEKNAIDSFPFFADTMEKIQGRPKIKSPFISSVKLPNYEPEEIKHLTNDVQLAIVGAGGAGAGALAGLAAFGAGAIVAAPAMIGAGFILCMKGFGLKKKAIENERQAKEMQKSADEIVAFYASLRNEVNSFRECFSAVYTKYNKCLMRVNNTLQTKSIWKEFSHEERENVKNTILLTRLLYKMCQVRIVEKQNGEDKLEKINASGLAKIEKQASNLLSNID